MTKQIPDCTKCTDSNSLIVNYCSLEWKKIMNKEKSFTLYKKGQQIFKEGQPVFGVYFIFSGKVKVFKSAPNGKSQIVRLAKSGDILGHRGFGGKLFYPISAAALVDTWICFIENNVFFNLLKANPELTFNLMLFYAEELKKSETRMRNMSQMSVKERIVEALFLMKDAYGIKVNENYVLDVLLTRREIAEIAGTTHEQVIRSLSEFKKEKFIVTKGKSITILKYDDLLSMIKEYGLSYLSN